MADADTGLLRDGAIDREAREQVIDRLREVLRSGQWDALTASPLPDHRDRTLHDILDELTAAAMLPLPLKPQGYEIPPKLRRDIERAILFLQTGLDYIDPDRVTGWWPRVVVGCGVGGLALVLAGWLLQWAGYQDQGQSLATLGGAGLAAWFTFMVVLPNAVGLAIAATIIFRVRVLRQDLTANDEESDDECWPFSSRDEYLEAREALLAEGDDAAGPALM